MSETTLYIISHVHSHEGRGAKVYHAMRKRGDEPWESAMHSTDRARVADYIAKRREELKGDEVTS